ncbi:sulfotransferase domain-containing protein [Patiriisocius sp. Uisw_047]|jgi:hypothetical protein|uniref:sulfotransferase domain-containing protein n=1 Tax=Patiriisocius sp. Uisw_047 TaxID=3230969 RepID=UPI0039E9DCDF
MGIFHRNKTTSNFIIAAPRSGTTWMSKMLNAHSEVSCVERRAFGNYADFVLDTGNANPRLRVTLDRYIQSLLLHHGIPRNKKDAITKAVLSTLVKEEKELLGKKIVVDKITPYVNTADVVINEINKHFPKSKILYLARDGRDVLTSGVFHWFNKQQSTEELNDFEKERRQLFLSNPDAKLPRFFQDKEIEQWANEWAQPLATINEAKKHHTIKVVHYEDMLVDTGKVLEECLAFFGGSVSKSKILQCLDSGSFKAMSKGREKGQAMQNAHIRKGISGDWKNYFTKKDGKLFHEIAGETLMKYGYITDGLWFKNL